MQKTSSRPTVSAQQYHALQTPVALPTPQELFEFEVSVLKDKGLKLNSTDVGRLRQLVPEEPQLFLVVPNYPDKFDPDQLTALIEVNGKAGKNYLNSEHLSDQEAVPPQAHLLLDVEDGRGRLNFKPSVSEENIRKEERLPYTTWYGLVHAIVFPFVLEDHYLDLCGSRYESDGVPSLYLVVGRPELDYYGPDDADPGWGAPSAGSRVGT